MRHFGALGFCVVVLCLLFIGCGGGGGGGGGSDVSGESSSAPDIAADTESAPRLASLCGMYLADEEAVVADPADAVEPVTVEVLSSDAAIITRQNGQPQLVKFHGITSEGVLPLRVHNGIDVLSRELAEGALFVSAGEECEVIFPGGGSGVLGQLYSMSGESMSERMLKEGSALPSPGDSCSGDTLSQCYQTIEITPREPTPIELDMQEVSIPSRCGAVSDGELRNPVTAAELVRVEPQSTDRVVITRLLGVEAGESQLIKLHGISSQGISPGRLHLGEEYIINASAGGAYFVAESRDCAFQLPDGSGIHGQLYTLSGSPINEELLAKGYATAAQDACGGELLQACYQVLQAEAPAEPPPPPPDHAESDEEEGSFVEGVIRDFLWKPVSESNGNVAVLVNPTNVKVVVSGAIQETLRNTGPSNGRGTTARGSAPGCRYGSNVTLEFFDADNQPIPIITGGTTITIRDGCDRVEFRK